MTLSRHPRSLIDILRRRETETGQAALLADTPLVVSGVPGGTSSSGGPTPAAQAIEERVGDPVGADLYAGRVWDIAGQPYVYSGAAKKFVRVGAGALILPAELDRTGSVAGQTIRSTGPATAPAWAKVGVGDLDPTGSASGQVPTSTGAVTAPTWQTPTGGSGGATWAQVVNESGASFANFTAVSGTWSSDGIVIKQTDNSAVHKRARFNTKIALGFGIIYEAEMMFPSAGQGIGADIQTSLHVGFEGTNLDGALTVLLELPRDAVYINAEAVTSLANIAFVVNADTWYKLRVVTVGEMVSVYVDGVLLGSVHLAQGAFRARGDYLGLHSYGAVSHFRNIKAWVLSGGAPA